ncbi:MAG: hypothetical protein Q9160_001148 [Pyrenula sp. 1 TL-2023]
MSPKEREQLQAEFSILSSLNHPNIVRYFHRDHIKATQDLHIYMEWCGGGDLGRVLRDLKSTGVLAKEEYVWRIFAQLATALYRCHNDEDPPEPGSNAFVEQIKPTNLNSKSKRVILHRDLKPENVFLGDDQTVKLGDFGLSKMILSNDFASTYVGTPYYMSPEICNAENYTSASDIWALGCIMHELCAKATPFDAKSHFHLMQKIRACELQSEVPEVFSTELRNAITSCLNLNPRRRPDAAALLSIPYMWVARKGNEMVALGKEMKRKEALASQRLQSLEADQVALRQEIEDRLRREWEVKARLQIDGQVQRELEKLHQRFEREVEARLQALINKNDPKLAQMNEFRALRDLPNPPVSNGTGDKESAGHASSVSTTGTGTGDDSALSSAETDITNLSSLSLTLDSPNASTNKTPSAVPAAKKANKVPFARSKTNIDSPADIDMVEPSPMTISSLNLSPRRNATAQAAADHSSRNIFAEHKAESAKGKWVPTLQPASSASDDEEGSDDDSFAIVSPTRAKIPAANTKEPFKVPQIPTRPGLGARQKTTGTMQKLTTQPPLFPSSTPHGNPSSPARKLGVPSTPSAPNLTILTPSTPPNPSLNPDCGLIRAKSDAGSPTKAGLSPDRAAAAAARQRISKIPSSAHLVAAAAATTTTTAAGALGEPSTSPTRNPAGGLPKSKVGAMGAGKTLIDLATARRGGRPVSKDTGRPTAALSEEDMKNRTARDTEFLQLLGIAERKGAKDEGPAAVWDPENEMEMPSPFLVRKRREIVAKMMAAKNGEKGDRKGERQGRIVLIQ